MFVFRTLPNNTDHSEGTIVLYRNPTAEKLPSTGNTWWFLLWRRRGLNELQIIKGFHLSDSRFYSVPTGKCGGGHPAGIPSLHRLSYAGGFLLALKFFILKHEIWHGIKNYGRSIILVAKFEVFKEVSMKNAVYWDVKLCDFCKNRRFRGTYHLC
jgi:hypothetical protein